MRPVGLVEDVVVEDRLVHVAVRVPGVGVRARVGEVRFDPVLERGGNKKWGKIIDEAVACQVIMVAATYLFY